MPRRPRLLVVGPLPPPVGGVETVTQAVLESPAFADFDVTHCSTTKGPTKEKVGRFDADNILWALRHFSRMSAAMTRSRPDVVYLAVSGTWSGFLRDAVLAFKDPKGLETLQIKGFVAAQDQEYDPIRRLELLKKQLGK